MRRSLHLALSVSWLSVLATTGALAQQPMEATSPLAYQLGAVTVQIEGQAQQDRPTIPCLRLGSDLGLLVEFDLLGQSRLSLSYRLRQQDASWEASRQPENSYLIGFASELLDPPTPSSGTIHSYDHYRLTLPKLSRRIKQSGNYQLEIYVTNEPEEPLLIVPFLIVEELGMHIDGAVDEARLGANPHGTQQVDLRLTLLGACGFTSRDLRLLVLQNARWDNAVTLTDPSYASLSEVRYEAEHSARFEGGNSYLKLEHLTDDAIGLGVSACLLTDSGTLLQTRPVTEPSGRLFRDDPAHQGIQRLRSLDTEEVSTEGEYHWVSFTLYKPRVEMETVVLAGDAFRYLPEGERQLTYDPTQRAYTKTLLLKSGYQEYQYLLRNEPQAPLLSTPLVGSHPQTQNYYTVLVYLRSPSDRHDRLIGYQPL